MLQAYILHPYSDTWEKRQISRAIESIQKVVGGHIELVPLPDSRVSLFCNEEGKLDQLTPSALWKNGDGRVLDILCGSIIAFGPADEEGECTDATEETYEALQEYIEPLGFRSGFYE